MKNRILTPLGCAITLLCLCPDDVSWAQGTAFTYQGRLHTDGAPANDTNDFTFTLFLTDTGGAPVAGPVAIENLTVADGLFTTPVDFGMGVFTGAVHWLEIGVRPGDSAGEYTTLNPRQKLTPTPYAVYASNAGTAATVAAGGVSSPALQPGAVTSAAIADGNVGTVDLTDDSVTSAKIANGTIAATDVNTSTFNTTFWKTDGNAGTTPEAHFVGTTDQQPLDLRVNGTRALRLQDVGDSDDSDAIPDGAPNVIGGSSLNFVSPGVVGATIGGGGVTNYSGATWPNVVSANFGTVSGGALNAVRSNSPSSTIGGGNFNVIASQNGTIAGGAGNSIATNSGASTIGGGAVNIVGAGSERSTIGGGEGNRVAEASGWATIGGGSLNQVRTNSPASTIGGGNVNVIASQKGTIAGGAGNSIATNSRASTIGGGTVNIVGAGSEHSTIAGGGGSRVGDGSSWSTISGGIDHAVGTNSYAGTIAGGRSHRIGEFSGYSSIGGGDTHRIGTNSFYSVIAGGKFTIVGDNSYASSVGGGQAHEIGTSSFFSTISGGSTHRIGQNSSSSTIGGGWTHSIGMDSSGSTIGGGAGNIISNGSQYATIPGGQSNLVHGAYSFAAGRRAKANHTGSFVWADSSGGDFATTGLNQFLIRASGFVGINKNTPATALDVNGIVTATSFSGSGDGLSELNASALVSGTLPSARLAGTYSSTLTFNNLANNFSGIGSGLTGLNASQLTSGTVPDARLSANVARRNQANTFTSQQIISAASSGLPTAALRITPTGASAIGLYVFQTSSDAAAVFENRGSGQQIVAFNGPGSEVFIVDNDGDVLAKSFAPISDRNRKENFAPVNPTEILEKVATLPISRWNFKDDQVMHVGPMAQDFHAAFRLGTDDKHIATVDADGVALAAIQGLNQKLEAELKEKDAKIADLETRLDHLEKMVSQPANLR